MADVTSSHTDDPDVAAGRILWVEMRTPEGSVFAGRARSVTVPGSKGSMGVLPRHAPLMSSLDAGYTRIKTEDGERSYVTGTGFVEVFRNHVLVLVDFADDPAAIDVARASAARDRAKARLREPGEDIDMQRAELSLQRAMLRIQYGSSR